MLALGFLLMIGMTLIADGFGFHVPKGYIYAAMGFSALVEGLNMLARRRREAGEGGAGRRALSAAGAPRPRDVGRSRWRSSRMLAELALRLSRPALPGRSGIR